jgi:peptidase C39-like protein
VNESLGPPDGATWELHGLRWKAGRHAGTLVGSSGLELVPGVSRGSYRRVLDPSPAPITRLVASLNPEPFPVGAALRLTLRARLAEGWSRWCSLGIVGSGRAFPASESSAATSAQPHVEADLWCSPEPVRELELRLELEAGELGGTPQLRRLALEAWDPERPRAEAAPERAAWGQELTLPAYSQRLQPDDLPERGCSPTSLAMVLAALGREEASEVAVLEVAAGVYDHGAKIYGNWSLNAAYAGGLGYRARVLRADSLSYLEREVLAGRAAVVSHRFEAGELPESPLPETRGHLLVVVGFTPEGDVLVHDPAANPDQGEEVRRTYPRAAFAKTWLERGAGITYRVERE